MNEIIRRRAAGDVPYFIVLFVYLVIAVLQTSFYKGMLPSESRLNAILLVLVLILCAREYLTGTIAPGSVLVLAAVLVIAANALRIGTVWTAFPFLLIFFGRNVSMRRLFTFAAVVILGVLLFIILSGYAGVILNYKRVEVNRKNHREYLGFLYALYPGVFFFEVSALFLAAHGRRAPLIAYPALAAGAGFIFVKTDGRLSFILTLILIAFFLIARLFPALVRALHPLFSLINPLWPACALLSIFLTVTFNGSVRWMYRLNALLGRRLEYGRQSLTRFGAGLLGRNVRWVGYGLNENGLPQTGDYLYVDNMYVSFLQRYGIIAAALALVVIVCALAAMLRARRYELLFIFLLLAVHGLIDDRILMLHYNIFWIAAAHAVGGRTREREDWDYASIT